MSKRKKYDKLEWLENHGNFTSGIQRTVLDTEWISWRSYNGFVAAGSGVTIELMYDDLFNEVKEYLFSRCDE